MKQFASPGVRLVVLLVVALLLGALGLGYFFIPRYTQPAPPQADYSIQLKDKQWDATVTGRFTVMGIGSFEPIPILILDLVVKNTSAREFLLDCVLVQSNDNGKTMQDVYYSFWALNIKPIDDLRVVKIPAQGSLTGKLAFELAPTEQPLYLDCGSDVQVQVQ